MRFHMFLHTGEKSRISCGLLAPSIHLVYIRRRSNESILGLQCIIIFRPIGYGTAFEPVRLSVATRGVRVAAVSPA